MGEFGWVDYVSCSSLLLISTAIGLLSYRHQGNTAREYITAGGKMHPFPVALSMLASFLSSITLIGQPAEVYLYGTHVWLVGLSSLILAPVVGTYMVPFFRKKNYFSSYQYFGERFSRKLQLLASTIFTAQMVIYLAAVLYAASLAMSEMAPELGTMIIVSVTFIACIFYTTVGGMKGVVMTDAFQVGVIFASMIFIIYEGTANVGGISVVLERSHAFNRTSLFNFDPDMTERYTVWSSLLGSSMLFIGNYGANQFHIQRYQTVKSYKDSIRMLWMNAIGWILVMTLCLYSGLLIFATYSFCDPLLTKKIKSPDQLFPFFIKETLHTPGIPGMFQCALFSAALSTVSTGINSLAAIWFAELEGTKFRNNISTDKNGILIKILAVTFGLISYIITFFIPYMGNLVQISITLANGFSGTLLGIFILGLGFQKSNSSGATIGLLASVMFLSWISIGYLLSQKRGLQLHVPLPSSIKECNNSTILYDSSVSKKEKAFILYRISFHWYGAIAVFITVVVGYLASYMFKGDEKEEQQRKVHKENEYNFLEDKELKPVVNNHSAE